MTTKLPPEISDAIGKLIDTRGAVLIAFAQVEWFLAKLISVAATFEEYKALDLSFSQDAEKRAARLEEILKIEGRLRKYAEPLQKSISRVMEHAQLRHFCAHGLLVRPDEITLNTKMHFRMFKMFKGGELKEESMDLTIKEFTEKEKDLMAAAKDFIASIRQIWTDLKLPALDDPTAQAS